jgi:hypothetical protein
VTIGCKAGHYFSRPVLLSTDVSLSITALRRVLFNLLRPRHIAKYQHKVTLSANQFPKDFVLILKHVLGGLCEVSEANTATFCHQHKNVSLVRTEGCYMRGLQYLDKIATSQAWGRDSWQNRADEDAPLIRCLQVTPLGKHIVHIWCEGLLRVLSVFLKKNTLGRTCFRRPKELIQYIAGMQALPDLRSHKTRQNDEVRGKG